MHAQFTAELERLETERKRLLLACLKARETHLQQIAALGFAEPLTFTAVKQHEVLLRQAEQAIGTLRYPPVPVLPDGLTKALRVPAPSSALGQQLKQELGPSRGRLLAVGARYRSPVPPAARVELDRPLTEHGVSGYSLIAPPGGDWLERPGLTAAYRMYDRAGGQSDPAARFNLLHAADDLGARRRERVEGNVVNNGAWPAVSFADRARLADQQLETTPQIGLLAPLRHEGDAHAWAQRLHKKYSRNSPHHRPGSWYVPDAVIAGELQKTPAHFAPIHLNWRDTPHGRQVIYTREAPLPGWHSRRGYAHEDLAQYL